MQNGSDIRGVALEGVAHEFEPAATIAPISHHDDFISVYAAEFVQKIREAVNHPEDFDRPLKGLKIIVDAGNGAGGFYAEKVLKPLGADIQSANF